MQKKIETVIALLLVAALAAVSASGVKESYRVQNIEKSAMVKSVGFDRADKCMISYVQSVISDSSVEHPQALVAAEGDSFSQAEKKAQILADKYLSLSYARHFLIGLKTAEKGIGEVLGFLLSSPVLQLSSYVYITTDSAEKLLSEMSRDDISTDEVLANLNLAGKQEGYYYPLTVLELAKAVEAGEDVCVPIISRSPAGLNTAKKTVVVFEGYAVLEGEKLKTVLSAELSRAYNLLAGRFERTVIACKEADILIQNCRAREHFRFQGDTLTAVDFSLKLKATLADSKRAGEITAAQLESAEREAQAEILRQTGALFAFLKEKQTDALHLFNAARRAAFGCKAIAPAAVFAAPYRIALRWEFDQSYTLNEKEAGA